MIFGLLFCIQSWNRFQMLLYNFPPSSSLEWSNKCIFISLKSLSFWNCRLSPLSLGDILFGHEPNVIAAPNLNRHIKRPCQFCLLWLRSPLKALCHLMLLCTLAWSAIIAGIKLWHFWCHFTLRLCLLHALCCCWASNSPALWLISSYWFWKTMIRTKPRDET